MIRYDLLSEDILGAEKEQTLYFDHCSGYCPGCEIRPWCDSGQSSCWPEDEKAGKMVFSKKLNSSVSASPQSLQLLIENDEEYQESRGSEYEYNQDGTNPMAIEPFDRLDEHIDDLSPNLN
jgi:hypothetical protein